MKPLLRFSIAAALGALLLSGCGAPQGQPTAASVPVAPNDVIDFATLYADNCAGCHGAEGRGGAAIGLADSVYLAIADDAAIRKVTANGVTGTSMPAFAQSAGGMLTDKQIDAITSGIRSHWARPGTLAGANPPAYAAHSQGSAAQGEAAFKTFCASCHGQDGRGGPKASSITDDSFLALVSDQGLRTLIIAGRPDLGAPDWRGNIPGKPMSDQDVTDVVAWLISRRVQDPGRPYSVSNNAQR